MFRRTAPTGPGAPWHHRAMVGTERGADTPRMLHRLAPLGLAALLALSAAVSAPAAAPVAAADFPAKDSRYHTYAEMVAELNKAVADHPAIVQKFSIGKSHQGREIWAAKISDNVATDESEPEVLFDGLHHAREHLTVEQTPRDPALADRRLRHERAEPRTSSTAARSSSSSWSTPTAASTT